ncbi:autotransporter assembly complex protein TamA [Novosphingobium beihaiensis]|uniref:BamA/TamA family outer membrane protein n=1 Tax=Novosphingobium beihaiensis TaxID=2930389 RepID=A0ABT0BN00_9SPHN|nr:BamA/TamA family outer membrane protein [Novosphingobium beihaiensis]MCJ2186418.1 BamA/TamA family outer membrane protein [Novosphingobium beihaiensis]
MPWLTDHPTSLSLRHRCGAGLFALSIALGTSATPLLARDRDAPSPSGQTAAPGQDDSESEQSETDRADIPAPPADAELPAVEPVISDREFKARVPALDAGDDPELDKPLESIEAFERRLAGEQADARPEQAEAPPLGQAALSDGDAAEEIGDAPVNDTELAAPLPPLGQFEVTPVEFAEDNSGSEKDVEVTYSVELQGLEEADKQTGVSLKGEFNSFSALKKGDGKAANTAMVRARLTEDSQLLQTILASEGWYSPVVRTRLMPSREKGSKGLSAMLSVNPGKRYVFSGITIKADPTQPPSLIEDNLALRPGEPIVADRVQGAEAQVAVALPENGYPFAVVGERDILLDRDTGEGAYTLPVTTGPRGRFDSFTTDGDPVFDASHIRVLARFKRGEIYDSRKVDDLRKALVATSLFRAVSVEPRRSGDAGSDGTEYVTLHVHQEAGPPRTIAGSVGYAAGEGVTTQATWTHRNLFPPEGALIAHATAGTQQQGVGATFRRSNAGKRDRTFEAVAEAFHNDYDAYSAYTGRLAARISRDSTPLWQKRYTYAYGVELLATAETDYDAETEDRKRRTYYVAGLNGQAGFDTTDDLLNPTRGFRLTALVQPETTVHKGFDPYVRARLDASTYYSLGSSFVLAGRVRLGTIQGTGLFDIAPSRRLYAGGGGSVRGYSYQGLGEQAPDGKPVGGRSLNEASFEARYRFGNYGVVAFVDAGQAYRETMPQFSDLRYGVGLGGRFYTNFGPIRLDVATPVNRRPGESRINVYVSIGQAF